MNETAANATSQPTGYCGICGAEGHGVLQHRPDCRSYVAPAVDLERLADDLRNASDDGVNDITFADNFDGTAARILAPLVATYGAPVTMVAIDHHPSLTQVVVLTIPNGRGFHHYAVAPDADAIIDRLAGIGYAFTPLD